MDGIVGNYSTKNLNKNFLNFGEDVFFRSWYVHISKHKQTKCEIISQKTVYWKLAQYWLYVVDLNNVSKVIIDFLNY